MIEIQKTELDKGGSCLNFGYENGMGLTKPYPFHLWDVVLRKLVGHCFYFYYCFIDEEHLAQLL